MILFRETKRRLEDQENEREKRIQISVDARHFPAFFDDDDEERRRATTKKIIDTNVPTSRDGRRRATTKELLESILRSVERRERG